MLKFTPYCEKGTGVGWKLNMVLVFEVREGLCLEIRIRQGH